MISNNVLAMCSSIGVSIILMSSGCSSPRNETNGLLLTGPIEPRNLEPHLSSSLPNDDAGASLDFVRSTWSSTSIRIPSHSVYVFPTYGRGSSSRIGTSHREWPSPLQSREDTPDGTLILASIYRFAQFAGDVCISPVRMCITPPWETSAQPSTRSFTLLPDESSPTFTVVETPVPVQNEIEEHATTPNPPSTARVSPENLSIPGARISSPDRE